MTFSITIVALTLASQFGSRLPRTIVRDLGNAIVLGFVSSFIYCLLVLRTVRGGDGAAFVPHVPGTIGVALALLISARSRSSPGRGRDRAPPRALWE